MSNIDPTYANALLVPTVDDETADLLSRFPGSILAGWSDDAPQRQLVAADAQAIQFEMLQRAAIAYAASPQQVRLLRAFYVANGYDTATAASLASSWVDLALTWYQTARLPATFAQWAVPLVATSTQTIDANSVLVLQAADGTFFLSNQIGSAVVLTSGNSFKGTVNFIARVAGTTGNVPRNSILYVNQAPAGVSVDLTIAQTLVSPARDAESDDDALDRAAGNGATSGRWGTLAGVLTVGGWRFVMQTPSAGGVASLTRIFVDDTNPFGPGTVGITVANAAGAPTAQELAIAVAQGVRYSIAGGPIATVGAAVVLTLLITVILKTDGSNALAADQCRSALVQLGGKTGDVLYVDDVTVVCKSIPGVVGDVVLSLTADVARPSNGVIVIDMPPGSVTAT